jgi:hypothetical protein
VYHVWGCCRVCLSSYLHHRQIVEVDEIVTCAPISSLRNLPLKRLKEYLAAYNIPNVGPKEKEDFVQAVIKARNPQTGALSPEAEVCLSSRLEGARLTIRHTIDATLFPKRAFQQLRTVRPQPPVRIQHNLNKLVHPRIAPTIAHLLNKHIAHPLLGINTDHLLLATTIALLPLLITIARLRSHLLDRVHRPQPLRRWSRPLHRLYRLLWALSLYQLRTSRLLVLVHSKLFSMRIT